MALYGSSVYGDAYYGPQSTATTAAVFTATPNPYGAISLSWSTPGGTWTRIRLLRSAFGFPTTADDGIILLDQTTSPGSYLDANLKSPAFYYYSLFVLTVVGASTQWIRSGDVQGQAVSDHGYGQTLLSWLPGIFTSGTNEVDGQPATATTQANFCNLLAADINRVRDLLDHLLHVEDPDKVSGTLLPYLGNQYGYDIEPAIGLRQNRTLQRNAVYLWQTNGTAPGITGLAKSLTGYGASIKPLHNLMLDLPTSSAEGGTGTWTVVSGSATLSWAAGYGTSYAPAYGPNAYANATNDNSQLGEFLVTATGSGAVTLGSADGSPTTNGIPISAGSTYTVSAYFQSATTSVSPHLDLVWYDQKGNTLSTTAGSAGAATTTTGWTQTSTTGVAPASAYYLGVHVVYPSLASGDHQYFDAVQAESGPTVMPFEDARRIDLVLAAARINEVPNAEFGTDVSGWAVGPSGPLQLLRDTGDTYNGGTASMAVQTTPAWGTYAADPTARNYAAAGVVNGVLYVVGGSNGSSLATNNGFNPTTNAWTNYASDPTARAAATAGVVNGVLYVVGGYNGSNLATNSGFNPSTNTWTAYANDPTARQAAAAGVINGVLYVVDGYNGAPIATNNGFNPTTNTWTAYASDPTARYGTAAGVINGVLYVVGGYNGSFLTTNNGFNPSTNAWTSYASDLTARNVAVNGVLNGVLYVVGGYNGSYLTTNNGYNPSANSWANYANDPTARDYAAAGVVNGVLYVVGGTNGTNLTTNNGLSTAKPFWNNYANDPTARYGAAAGAVNGVLYVVGGFNGSNLATNNGFNPVTNTWTAYAADPTARYYAAAAVVNGVLYVVGGTNGSNLATNNGFNPATNTWTNYASDLTARYYAAAGVINGVLYVVGGTNGSNLATNNGFNPATNTWTNYASDLTARESTIADAINGILYVVGGYSASVYLTTNNGFNPATNTWTVYASDLTARTSAMAGVINGVLYVVGGFNGSNLATNNGFNPATNTWTAYASDPTARQVAAAGAVNGVLYVVGGFNGSNLATNNGFVANATVSTGIGVANNTPFTFSAYVMPYSGTSSFSLSVAWQDPSGKTLSSATSTPVTLSPGQWTRLTIETQSPAVASSANLSITGAIGYYVTDVLAEFGPTVVGTYFNTSNNPGDAVFEGTAYESRLHLYPSLGNKKARLLGVLPDHVPLGAAYSVLVAQPRTGAYTAAYSNTY